MKTNHSASKLWLAALLLSLWGCSGDGARPQTPYLAYTVIQHAVIDLTKGKGEFADTLTKYFGTTRSEGKDVIDYVEAMETRDRIEADVEMKVRESLSQLKAADPDKTRRRFLVDVISPYLQCTLHGNALPPDLRQAIQDRYAQYYGGGSSSNGLAAVIASIESYRTGASFFADSLDRLNLQLRAHGSLLQLSNRTQQACLLDVADTLLPSTPWKGGTLSVIEAKRSIPCLLPSEFGYSTMGTDYVVVLPDRISERAHEFLEGLDPGGNGKQYQGNASEQMWGNLGLDMNSDDANRIIQALLRRNLSKSSARQITDALTVETAIHEAKHKTDEIDLPAMNINWDSEISAHLTQAICSDSPFHSLVDAIGRIEGFYVPTGDPDMARLLVQLWGIAAKAAKPGYQEELLRQDLQQVYDGYVTFSSKTHLPPLDAFRQRIAPTIKGSVLRRQQEPSDLLFRTIRRLKILSLGN